MHGGLQIVLVILFTLLLRWCVTYHPYSGQGKPPLFGDYEAQRHWQEITLHLPIEKWYINTTENNLQYWGLDYPPLTAYHSLLLGYIANTINSSFVKLYESRGFSSDAHKYFMRLTVLFADALIYLPAMIYFVLSNPLLLDSKKEKYNFFGFKKKNILLITLLVYPGLILIDYGHFQYNCVSLGLFISAVSAMLRNSFIVGSFLFVAALNYKQMELYHALPIFFYILGKYTPMRKKFELYDLGMLLSISLTVILTFFVIWLPFLKNWEIFVSVVFRLFPFARGVFEDKVANIWCTVNVIYKLRNSFTNSQLAQICLTATTLAVLPTCINLYLNPKKEKFIISLVNSSLAFFLFSFQVHEKSILLVAVPVLLHFHADPLPCFWFLLISHFSMLPLFIKDDLYLAYIVTLVFYITFILWAWPDMIDSTKLLNNDEQKQYGNIAVNQRKIKMKHKDKTVIAKLGKYLLNYFKVNALISFLIYNRNFCILVLFYSSMLGVTVLSVVTVLFKPPNQYPDLFALSVSVYSCIHFTFFYLYFNYKQIYTPKPIMNKYKLR